MVFHWSLSDSKSPQVSRTLLSILSDLNAAVWMVSVCTLTYKSSSSFTNSLGIVPSTSITIGIGVTLFHRFLKNSLARSRYVFLFLLSFYSVICQDSKVHYSVVPPPLSLLIITKSGHLGIRWSVCISKSQITLYVSFSETDSGLCIYHLFV